VRHHFCYYGHHPDIIADIIGSIPDIIADTIPYAPTSLSDTIVTIADIIQFPRLLPLLSMLESGADDAFWGRCDGRQHGFVND